MATVSEQIQQIYIGLLGRAADKAGLDYWTAEIESGNLTIEQLRANIVNEQPEYAAGLGSQSRAQVVAALYENLFDRPVEDAGLEYWVNGGGATVNVDQLVLALINGASGADQLALDNKVDAASYYTEQAGDNYNAADAAAAVADVDATVASLDASREQTDSLGEIAANNVFTLTEHYEGGTAGTAEVRELYWGWDPAGNDNDIPVSDLVDFLVNITGLDMTELGLVDDDGIGPFDQVTNLEIALGGISDNNAAVTVNLANGNSVNTEATLGVDYIDFLNDLIFDAEDGQSRLFEKVTVAATPASQGVLAPVELTTEVNNGGTIEVGTTGAGDDVIVAGRTELLHQAYIDGGAGNNTLEVDAKGVYAQPLQLLNIQTISIQNLPNVYTGVATTSTPQYQIIVDPITGVQSWVDANGNPTDDITQALPVLDANGQPATANNNVPGSIDTYPDLATNLGNPNSFIDVSRASSLEDLIVTEGSTGGVNFQALGTLTVVGIRGDATTTLDGYFSAAVTLDYGHDPLGDGTDLVLSNVSAVPGSNIRVAHNSDTLNIESAGGGNVLTNINLGGSVSFVNISGDAELIYQGAGLQFNQGHPATIDASENTAGVDLIVSHNDELIFVGTTNEDDHLATTATVKSANITGGHGDNEFIITATEDIDVSAGEGDNEIDVTSNGGNVANSPNSQEDDVTVVVGGGDNDISANSNDVTTVIATDGNNEIVAIGGNSIDDAVVVNVGDGNNEIAFGQNGAGGGLAVIDAGDGSNLIRGNNNGESIGSFEINVGNGGNTILIGDSPFAIAPAAYGATTASSTGTISTGTGNDDISVIAPAGGDFTVNSAGGDNTVLLQGQRINVSMGDGDDSITLVGDNIQLDDVALPGEAGFFSGPNPPAALTIAALAGTESLIVIDTGAGENTVRIGDDNFELNSSLSGRALTAIDGSSITGENITLIIDSAANLFRAVLDVNKVVLTNSDPVVLHQGQVSTIGAANFEVDHASFGAQANIVVMVTEDTVLSQMIDLDALSPNINLSFSIVGGATLELTAEELHTYVAVGGIDSADELSGKVVITEAGLNFNAFNNAVLDSNNNPVVTNPTDGTLSGTFAGSDDVTIIRSAGGFERPAPGASSDTFTIDSDVSPVIDGATEGVVNGVLNTQALTLKLEGSADLVFDGVPVDLGQGFTVDMSDLSGSVTGLRINNFQEINGLDFIGGTADDTQIIGNGTGTRIDVGLMGSDRDSNNGNADEVLGNFDGLGGFPVVGGPGNSQGLISQGVASYVVVDIDDGDPLTDELGEQAIIYVCDKTEDLEVLGLQGNFNAAINFLQVNWGTSFLLEGDGDVLHSLKANGNPNFSNVGTLNADFFWAGADAVVNLNNQGTDLGADGRPLFVAGINITNARSITVNVEDGDAVIGGINNGAVTNGTLNADLVDSLTFNSANDVTLQGNLSIGDNTVVASMLSSIDASGVDGTFTIDINDGSVASDISAAAILGVDALLFSDAANPTVVTVNADQVVSITEANINDAPGVMSTLHVNGVASQAIALSQVGVDVIGNVTFADQALVQVDSATDFGGAAKGWIPAVTGATQVEMNATQFNSFANGNDRSGLTTVDIDSAVGNTMPAGLVITDPGASEYLNVGNVNVPVTVRISSDLVANADNTVTAADEEMEFVGFGAGDTLEIGGGTVDLSNANQGAALGFAAVSFTANAEVTMSAAQVFGVGAADANGDGIADAWAALSGLDVTLNITGLTPATALNLNAIQAAGINIGTVTIADNNLPQDYSAVAGATFGGADEIITPTADTNDAVDGLEPTAVTMAVAQYLTTAGIISGDSPISLTGLVNNVDSDGDFVLDQANYDLSGINNANTVTLGTVAGPVTVTLADTADLGGFQILLDDGHMIQFATEAQASGARVTVSDVDADLLTAPTAVAWLFDSVTGEVDTVNYDSNLTTLFVLESLVDGQIEESLWTTLAGTIAVEKTNIDGIPDVLIAHDRINTFEALTQVASVNYDDLEEFATVDRLTINLEGNTDIGEIFVGDTNNSDDQSIFRSLTINSYEDRTSLGAADTGFNFQPNKVGNINLNAGSVDELVSITLNTFDRDAGASLNDGNVTSGAGIGYMDGAIVGVGAAERDGLALEVGDINFNASTTTAASLTLTGPQDITINDFGIFGSLTRLNVDASGMGLDGYNMDGSGTTLTIGGVDVETMLPSADTITYLTGYTSPLGDVIGTVAGNDLLVITGDADVNAAALDVEAVHFAANAEFTLTAADVLSIGIADANLDGIADNWTVAPGVSVTVNVTGVSGATAALALNLLSAAGINIGEVTITDAGGEINPATHFGGADQVTITVDTSNTAVEIAAQQYQQISNGNLVESLTAAATAADFKASVTIDNVEAIESSADGSVNIDLSTVVASGANTIELGEAGVASVILHDGSAGDADVSFNAAANLGAFSVTLYDLDDAAPRVADDVAGETVRFTSAVQAERQIIVNGADNDAADNPLVVDLTQFAERDTNVVWDFDTITGTAIAGKVIVGNGQYDPELGRIWVNDQLVDGVNVEELFTSVDNTGAEDDNLVNLASSTIIHVVNTADLAELAGVSTAVDRVVEIEAFGPVTNGLIFDEEDLLVHVQNLTLSLGGDVNLGDLTLDNVLAPAAQDGTDEFGGLTINSYLAAPGGLYDHLLPENWVAGVNVPPSGVNMVGDISSGTDRAELARVTINAPAGAAGGVGIDVGTIFFSDDGGDDPLAADINDDPTALLTLAGASNIVVKSLDTSNAFITALVIDNNMTGGIFTLTGGSPAADMPNTTALTINSGVVAATTNFGSPDTTDNDGVFAGVNGPGLRSITITEDGVVDLGALANIYGVDPTTVDPMDLAPSFILDLTGAATVSATLGEANVDNVETSPALAAGGTWTLDFSGANAASELTVTNDVVFGAGTVNLIMDTADLIIQGVVDMTAATAVNYTNAGAGSVVLDEANSLLLMTDEVFNASGLVPGDFVDSMGGAATLEVTAELLATLGSSDLSNVRGYGAYNIANGLTVTLREDQADVASVYQADGTTLDAAGDFTNATVTVFVQETGFGNQDISNLIDVDALVLEADTTDNDLVTPGDQLGYTVVMDVEQASDLVGNITKNGNTVTANAGVKGAPVLPDTETRRDLTDPVGDGSVPAFDLAEVDALVLDDADGTIINQTQFNTVTAAGIDNSGLGGRPLHLIGSGNLSAVDFTDGAMAPTQIVTHLILNGDTTVLAAQEVELTGITMDDAMSTHTLTINNVELLGQDVLPVAPGPDGIIDPSSTINIDLSDVAVNSVVANMATTTLDPADGVTVVDGLFTLTGDLNGYTLSLSGDGTVATDVAVIADATVAGTAATVNVADAGNVLNDTMMSDDPISLAGVAAAIAGTLTLGGTVVLDVLSDLGSFDVVMGANDLTAEGSQVSGKTVTNTTGTLTLNNVTNADDLTGLTLANPGDLIINALGTSFTIDAAQAGGATIADSAADMDILASVIVSNFGAAPDADLSLIDATVAGFTIDVQLDSTGDVAIGANADLSVINDGADDTNGDAGDSQVTVSGNGTVTVTDGAHVGDTDFIVGADATLVANQGLTGDSIIDEAGDANVSGLGTLVYAGLDSAAITLEQDIRFSQVELTSGDSGVVVNGFQAGTFAFPGLLLGAHQLDFTPILGAGPLNFSNVSATIDASGAAPHAPADDILSFSVANVTAGDAAALTAAFNSGAFETGGDQNIQFNNGDERVFLTTDGTDSDVWNWQDGVGGAVDGLVQQGELSLIGVLNGVDGADLVALNANNFVLS